VPPQWPTVESVKLSLGATTAARDGLIGSAVAAAIEQVATDLGYRDISVEEESESGLEGTYVLMASVPNWDTDEWEDVAEIDPTHSLSSAALILAVMVLKAPEAPYGIAAAFDLGAVRVAADHPTYARLLTGARQRFGVA
jgi:hypothetical protein